MCDLNTKIRVSGIEGESIVDGPGFRLAVFAQGCFYNCEGCHNPHTHDPNGGYEITLHEIFERVRQNPLLDGVTLTGGEPFLQAKKLVPLAKACKGENLHVMAYSGNIIENLMQDPDCLELLQYVDLLIDGQFELPNRTLNMRFRGSTNQRAIDVQETLKTGHVVETEL